MRCGPVRSGHRAVFLERLSVTVFRGMMRGCRTDTFTGAACPQAVGYVPRMRSVRTIVLWSICGVLLGVVIIAVLVESNSHRYGSLVETPSNPLGR